MNAKLKAALEALRHLSLVASRTFSGPSPFSGLPVVALTLAVDSDEDRHGLESVADWCTVMLLDAGGGTVDAGVSQAGTSATLWVGYDNAEATQLVIAEALAILGEDGAFPAVPEPRARALLDIVEPMMPHWQMRIMAAAARARSIPVLATSDTAMRQYGWGARGGLFWETTSNADGTVGHKLAGNKAGMKNLISQLGLPTPRAELLHSTDSPEAVAERIGWPLVVKPLDRGGGRGVTANIRTVDQLDAAVARARTLTIRPLLIEQHVSGNDYRLMVVDGAVLAAVERSPATIIGDGRRTIEALVDALNATRRRDLQSRLYLKQIALDSILLEQLAAQGLGLDSVPATGETIRLRSNANRTTGADCIDVTARMHPDVAAAAVAICATIGLRCAGIDYLSDDIALPPERSNGGFIEVNTTPGLAVIAAAGIDAVAIAGKILGDVGRIPSTLIVAPADARPALIDKLRRAPKGKGIAWLCGGMARNNDRDLDVAQRSRQDRLRMLLMTRQTRAILIVCSAEELMNDGLPLDRFDTTIVCEPLPSEWQAVVERHSGKWLRAEVGQISWRNQEVVPRGGIEPPTP